MDRVKVSKFIIRLILIFMVLVTLWKIIIEKEFLYSIGNVLLIIGAVLPSILNLKYKERFPIELHLLWVLLILPQFVFGNFEFYTNPNFWFVDDIAHLWGGVVLAIFGFYILLSLNNYKDYKFSLALIGVFAFSFAVTFGVIWEIIEFFIDSVFGYESQYGFVYHAGKLVWDGVNDTMIDLIEDLLAALVTTIILVKKAKRADRRKLEKFAEPLRQYLG